MTSFSQKNPFITTLLLSVSFGFVAGAVGAMIAATFAPTPAFQGTSPSVLRGRLTGATQDETAPSVDPARAAVLFVSQTSRDAQAPARSYISSAAFGAGIVLTSDGWLVTNENAFPKGRTPQETIAVVGAKAYPIKDVVRDPFTGVIFLKIDGNNLPVTAFGQGTSLAPGGFAFAFDREGGLRRLGMTEYDDISVATASELVWSSERAQKALHLTGADDLLPGSMVLNKKGEVVGVLAGKDARGVYAVPFESFSGIIGGVLREKRVVRPYLGVRFADLSRLLAPDAAHSAGRGAWVVGFAVTKKSPADLAGIVPSEVIEAVNSEEVSVKNALPELLAEYPSGSVVTLTVLGTKGERTVDVTLGETRASH